MAFASARWPDAAWLSSRPASAPARDHPVPGRRPRRVVPSAQPLFPCSGGMLMRTGHGGVDTDIPGDHPCGVSAGLQHRQDRCPDPGALPAAEQPIDRLPGTIDRRNVPPRGTDTCSPADPVDQLSSGPPRRAARFDPDWQERFQHRPLRVGQIEPPRHSYAGHEVSGVQVFLVVDRSTGDLTHSINDTPIPPLHRDSGTSRLRDTP